MKSILLIVGFVQIYFILKFSLSNGSEVKFTNAVCKSYNESWVIMNMCRLRAINRNKTVFNLNCTLLHAANNIRAETQFLLKANGYKPWLYKPTFDVCRFLKKPYNPVIMLVFNVLKNYTNFNTIRCPLLGVFYIDGFHVRYESLTVPWPSGEYLLKINWLFDNRIQFSTDVYFTVVE